MRRLEKKVILVAGGGAIGGGLARRFAEEGAAVVLGDIDLAAAEAVVSDIAARGGTAIATPLDGADEASTFAAVALACDRFGGLDGLHANFASFADADSALDVLTTPASVLNEVMRVNAMGFVLCTRAALPPMLERGAGSIVYTSSAAAYIAEPTRFPYAMSKAAGHALMRHVASRFGPEGIRANVIAPGMIAHDDWSDEKLAVRANFSADLRSIKRIGQPLDIAAMSALLMSDEGSFVTGQTISVDGGRTMRA